MLWSEKVVVLPHPGRRRNPPNRDRRFRRVSYFQSMWIEKSCCAVEFCDLIAIKFSCIGWFLLSQTEDSGQHIRHDGNETDAVKIFLGEVAQNMAGGHLKKKFATELLQDGSGVMPVDAMRNVVYQVCHNQLLLAHGSGIHIPDVNDCCLGETHCGNPLPQGIRHWLQQRAVREHRNAKAHRLGPGQPSGSILSFTADRRRCLQPTIAPSF